MLAALGNMRRSGARYLLASHYPAHTNRDITTGSFRPVNLATPPFHLGEPLAIVSEHCPVEGFSDKSLAV